MRPLILVSCLTLTSACCYGQDKPSFEVSTIKPASPDAHAIVCSGGPGTSDPGLWRCSNVPVGLIITQAYGFLAYQFRPNDPCCSARFDINARVPAGTTKEQFQKMQQGLLVERLGLKLHSVTKEMPVYELTVADGAKLKTSPPGAAPARQDPWLDPSYTIGKDGYPVFAPGSPGGVAGNADKYHWLEPNLPMIEIAKTLSYYLGRPVIDRTGLAGKYDIDLRWGIDIAWILESRGYKEDAANLPDTGPPGPPLQRAVLDQLGLKLTSKKGSGEIIVIDHLEKAPL